MCKSLLDAYSKLDRSYYNIRINTKDLFNGIPKQEIINCNKFIKEHFIKGKKQEALCIPWQEEYNKNGKHRHTVSLYFLGLLFESCFGTELKNKLIKLIPTVESWYEYKYTWFLTCLYHDVASSIEHSTLPNFPNDAQKQLSYYIGDLNIKYTSFSHVPLKPSVSLNRFSESLICNYFHYRAEAMVLEHGIIGGYYLFNKLYKNFLDETFNHNWDKDTICTKDGLQWRLEHLDHFAYISDAIICHNLWTTQDGDENGEDLKYKAFGLTPLIVKGKDEKLNFNQYPLQFLLCLFDSIEPIKRFEELSAKDVLQKIFIQFDIMNYDKYTFYIYWDKSLEIQKNFNYWKSNIQDMRKWMDIFIENKGNYGLEISF